jgi:ABC-type hemin transport system ATPase subunit
MMQLDDISYSVKGRPLIEDINASWSSGDLVALLGPNGAGKSTLLKVATGALQAQQGDVLLDGQPLRSYSSIELAKRRAVLSQLVTVSAGFTTKEVVLMGRYPHNSGRPQQHDHKVVREVMEITGTASLAERSLMTLSGGEQQRVHFARVLAQVYDQEQPILFLDEPVNNLDLPYQYQLLDTIHGIARKGGLVVVVLHDLTLAARYADRIMLLKSGRVAAQGTAEAMLNPDILEFTYGLPVQVVHDHAGNPIISPQAGSPHKQVEHNALSITF